MRALLTSCGLETRQIEDEFLAMLAKTPRMQNVIYPDTGQNYFVNDKKHGTETDKMTV